METKICKRTPASDQNENNICHVICIEAQSLTFDKYVRRGSKKNKKKNPFDRDNRR